MRSTLSLLVLPCLLSGCVGSLTSIVELPAEPFALGTEVHVTLAQDPGLALPVIALRTLDFELIDSTPVRRLTDGVAVPLTARLVPPDVGDFLITAHDSGGPSGEVSRQLQIEVREAARLGVNLGSPLNPITADGGVDLRDTVHLAGRIGLPHLLLADEDGEPLAARGEFDWALGEEGGTEQFTANEGAVRGNLTSPAPLTPLVVTLLDGTEVSGPSILRHPAEDIDASWTFTVTEDDQRAWFDLRTPEGERTWIERGLRTIPGTWATLGVSERVEAKRVDGAEQDEGECGWEFVMDDDLPETPVEVCFGTLCDVPNLRGEARPVDCDED